MNTAHKMNRIHVHGEQTNPQNGQVYWSPLKSLWMTTMYLGSGVAFLFAFSWSAFALFLGTSALTLCLGHSVGMHRRLIHNSFSCPGWLEYGLVYCGTLIGLAGPFSIIDMHEMRDWAQRQPYCHDYFASRQPLWKDWFWLLHCDIQLDHPPTVQYEARIVGDRIYRFLENTRVWQQLPWAVLFYGLGGWSWLLWGICVRVSVCMTGHWLVGYVAHRFGQREWHIEGAGVQGYNVRLCGLITMGECWHNNHHAFPDSAQLGLHPFQSDPGWWLILLLQHLGLAWDVQQPNDLPERETLKAIASHYA